LFLDLQYHFAKQQLDDAIAREDYTEASRLQSTVDSLELTYRHSKLVQDRQAHEGILFPLGSCIVHRRFGYRGIVVGYDHLCNAPEEWCKAMRVDILPRGRQQPFYHVLVDVRDRPGGQTTYVAEENVALARRSHLLDHPLVEKYFQMRRAADGGWVYYPSQELRSLYYKDGGF